MPINKDKLIRMMYERPVLWNHKHADYRNGQIKQQGWNEIAAEFQIRGKYLSHSWYRITFLQLYLLILGTRILDLT